MRRILGFLVATLILMSIAVPRAASAHAILTASEPAIDGTISGPDVTLVLHFNSRIDHKRSVLTLTGPDGAQSALAIAPDTAEDEIQTHATLKPGAYTLRWQVLSGDGHITRGDVPFTVAPAPPPTP